jgi:hypothetical protein
MGIYLAANQIHPYIVSTIYILLTFISMNIADADAAVTLGLWLMGPSKFHSEFRIKSYTSVVVVYLRNNNKSIVVP